ncbi:hypothetical protein Trydic_g8105 [Trypoxylus dichotomus]
MAVKHGGDSVMIWCYFDSTVVDNIVKIEGILRNGLGLLGPNFVFQQDKDPKHPSKLRKDYLQHLIADGSINIMEWLTQSPNL